MRIVSGFLRPLSFREHFPQFQDYNAIKRFKKKKGITFYKLTQLPNFKDTYFLQLKLINFSKFLWIQDIFFSGYLFRQYFKTNNKSNIYIRFKQILKNNDSSHRFISKRPNFNSIRKKFNCCIIFLHHNIHNSNPFLIY